MKKGFIVVLFMSLFGASSSFAEFVPPSTPEGSLAWGCYLKFAGVSQGLQVILGHFETEAAGVLTCKSVDGETIQKNIKLVIASKLIGLTVGAGYFELQGISSEFSLLNKDADKIFGDYQVTHYEAALGRGLGYFSAVKLGLPQLAYNVSVQYLSGAGLKAGIEKMVISEVK